MRVSWKRVAVLALALMLAFGSAAAAFGDAADDEAGKAVKALRAKGVVSGDGKSFAGDRAMTLAEGLVMITKGLKLKAKTDGKGNPAGTGDDGGRFDNVKEGAWYAGAFRAAARAGLDVPRDADPGQTVSREYFLHLLAQALQATGDYPFQMKYFIMADGEDITPAYEDSIQLMLNGGFVRLDDDGRLRPRDAVTRRDAAVWLHAVMKFVERHAEDRLPDDGRKDGARDRGRGQFPWRWTGCEAPGNSGEGKPAETGKPAEPGKNGKSIGQKDGSAERGKGAPWRKPCGMSGDDGTVKEDVTYTVERIHDEVAKVTLSRGEKPNSGYGIEIAAIVFPGDGTAVIHYRLRNPDPDRMYLQVITHPTATAFVPADCKVVLKQVD